jgi:heptosyltransferase-1
MATVLIVRLGAMGDVLHALPAAGALHSVRPQEETGWVIEERWADLLCTPATRDRVQLSAEKPLVNHIHTVDTRRWRNAMFSRQTWREIASLRHQLQAARYERVVDVQGSLKSALTASAAKSWVRGSASPRESAARLFYDETVSTRAPHVVEQAFELLGVTPGARVRPELPRDAAAEAWCSKELAARDVRQFALLAPTAGWAGKEWPAEKYGEVARSLAARRLSVLVNAAPAEVDAAARVVAASAGAAQVIRCTVPQLVAITRRAQLLVGGDTGPMHLANLLGVPVVALFGPTDPARNGPYYEPATVLRNPKSATSYSHVETVDPGLAFISAEEVAAAAEKLL